MKDNSDNKLHKKRKTTKVDYTLEQFLAEQKRNKKIDNLLDKMANVMSKFETALILHDHRIKQLERKTKK